jgi:hypothetical protein
LTSNINDKADLSELDCSTAMIYLNQTFRDTERNGNRHKKLTDSLNDILAKGSLPQLPLLNIQKNYNRYTMEEDAVSKALGSHGGLQGQGRIPAYLDTKNVPAKVEADGSCLFNALALCVYGKVQHQDKIR